MKFDPLEVFYNKHKSDALQFNFDNLQAPPIFSMLPPSIDQYLYYIATNPKYSSNPKMKFGLIDQAVKDYGFVLLGRGTNRCIYKHQMNEGIVLKVGFDRAGAGDSFKEIKNMMMLRPFVTKCFDVSPSGVMGLFERVIPITYKDEFASVAEDIFDVITKCFIGKYILADIGTDFYMNWGIRSGFGPVLLDYPFMYPLDGKKLHCINTVATPAGPCICNGLIDYDEGFNHLKCTKCGKQYFASDLAKENQEGQLEIVGAKLGGITMSEKRYFLNGKEVTEEEMLKAYFGDTKNPVNNNDDDNSRIFEAAPPPLPPSYQRKKEKINRQIEKQSSPMSANENKKHDGQKETRFEYMLRNAKYVVKDMFRKCNNKEELPRIGYALVSLIANTDRNNKYTEDQVLEYAKNVVNDALTEIIEAGKRAMNNQHQSRPQPNNKTTQLQNNTKKVNNPVKAEPMVNNQVEVTPQVTEMANPDYKPKSEEQIIKEASKNLNPNDGYVDPVDPLRDIEDDSPTEEDDKDILEEVEKMHEEDSKEDIIDAIDNLAEMVEEGEKIKEENNGVSPQTQEGINRIKQINDMGNEAPHMKKEVPAPKKNPAVNLPGNIAFTF